MSFLRNAIIAAVGIVAISTALHPVDNNAKQNGRTDSNVSASIGADFAQPSPSEIGRICRAVVAAINGRDVNVIRISRESGGQAEVMYSRSEDNSTWTIQCAIEGDRIIWRAIDAFGPGTGAGRWRNGPYDDYISVSVEENHIIVRRKFFDQSEDEQQVRV